MKRRILMMSVFVICLVGVGCSTTNEPTDTANGLSGFIYYTSGGSIYRMQLSNQTSVEQLTNARYPEITDNGEILCVEIYPKRRLIYTDVGGVNKNLLLETDNYPAPLYKKDICKPRLSNNQKYIAYDGRGVSNQHTYVIDAKTGALIQQIGDDTKNQPMINPSWAPDGSIFVQGMASTNNGIYKVSADFSTVVRIDPNLNNVSEPSVSPDGKMIAFISEDKLWTMGIDGSNPTQLNTSASQLHMPVWSPDSKYIAVVSRGRIHIIDPNLLTDTEMSEKNFSDTDDQFCWVK